MLQHHDQKVTLPTTIKQSPSFILSQSIELLPIVTDSDKHTLEYNELKEEVKNLNQNIKESIQKLQRLHAKRAKLASAIVSISSKTREEKKPLKESEAVLRKRDRLDRLQVCSRLLENKSKLSTLITKQPLPDLLPPLQSSQCGQELADTPTIDSISALFRNSPPDAILRFLNENAIPQLIFLCENNTFDSDPLHVNLENLIEHAPSSLASVSPQSRQVVIKKIFDSLLEMSQIMTTFEDISMRTDPNEIISLIETSAANLIKTKRCKLLLATDGEQELLYIQAGVRNAIPLKTGLIAECVKSGSFQIVHDPNGSSFIDLAVESRIFEGASNAIICPLYLENVKCPFVFVGLEKLKEGGFTNTDYVLLYYMFHLLSNSIRFVQREITGITESDLKNLVEGLSEIADAPNIHDMIQKIIETGNQLTNASITRFYSIINRSFCDETPGTKVAAKMLPVDRGLVCQSAVAGKTMNFFLPRRENSFSVQIDDITEPRLWTMIASPTRFNGETKGSLVLYNRHFGTFFSSKERFIVQNLSQCVCSFLYSCCESSTLHESLTRNSTNSMRAYNLTVYSLKSIQYAGTQRLFKEMTKFCENLRPNIEHRFLVFEHDKLTELPGNTPCNSEPQLLDAICNLKPTAATSGDQGVLVLPIKHGDGRIFLLEFRAALLQLKSTEENNGMMQRTRLLQAFEDPSEPLKLPENPAPQNLRPSFNAAVSARPGLPNQQLQLTGSANTSNIFTPQDLSISTVHLPNSVNLPFIPLSLKSIHEDDTLRNSSTSLFDLNPEHKTSDKLIIVSSRRPSMQQSSFETQLDEDELQIFPFDPFLTNILQSFSMMSARQLVLHRKIVSLQNHMATARAMHALGNTLACPLSFSELLETMMACFTQLIGRQVSLRIFDPPLVDASDTDPTALNLERDRHIFASIKIPTALSLERSTALAAFADLLSSLMEGRQMRPPLEEVPEQPPIPSDGFDFDCSNLQLQELIVVGAELLHDFRVDELFDCGKEGLIEWLRGFASSPDDGVSLPSNVDALQIAREIFMKSNAFGYFNVSELAIAGISIFLGSCYPRMHPNFKYSHIISQVIESNLPVRVVARVSTIIVMLSEPYDLIGRISENYALGIGQLLRMYTPRPTPALYARFTLNARRGTMFETQQSRSVFVQYLTEIGQLAPYLRHLNIFANWALTSMKETLPSLLNKIRLVAKRLCTGLVSFDPSFSELLEDLEQKEEWLLQQDPSAFGPRATEEEEEGNMSLMDAR